MPDVDLDAAVLLSDWNVDASGRIKDDFADPAVGRGSGRKGGVVFANNAAAPLKLKARPGARVRLRLGNAATARLATVATSGAKIHIVAVDGQPGEPFEPLNSRFPMGPGARFELMFDMPRNPGADVRLDLRGDAGAADQPFIAIVSEGEPMDVRPEPPRLAANPRLPAEIALESARRCDFAISGGGPAPFAINGATFVEWAPKSAYVIPRGQPAVVALANKTAFVQAIRLWGTSRGSCIRWTTAGSPIGATQSSSSPAIPPVSRSSPTTRADGRWNRLSPNTAQPEWEPGFRWCEAANTSRHAESETRGAQPLQETAR